uniref:CDC42 small effector protein 2-C-like n=1 Tax=Pristiophorus japonicus TaxID=55135 RepID=UPI00398E51E4
MSDSWACFSCCAEDEPEPKRRVRIDRSMIGEPMNFVHTAHVGSGDMSSTQYSAMGSVQEQMKSKGGYTKCTNATD